MKTVLQVLFGLIMGAAGVVVSVYLGLLLRGQPGWRTGVGVLVFLAVTQWVAFFAFRHRITLQILFGLVCAAVTVGLIYSSLPIFWETRYPDGSSPITWRSDVALLLLLSLTQWVSSLAFRWIKRYGRRPPSGTTVPQAHR
jgi:hypothetical protein